MSDTPEFATVRQVSLPVGATSTHEARSGQSYTLRKDKPAFMPLEDGYSFLIDKAFEVRHAERVKNPDHDPNDPESVAFNIVEGDLIKPVSTKKVEGGRVDLDEDEVIAKLDELTQDALLKRCKRLDGSQDLSKRTKKEDLVTFLIENKPKPLYGRGRGSEGIEAEMDRTSLDGLIDLSANLGA